MSIWRRPTRSQKTITGLGDVVHLLAAPIVAVSDAIFHTDLKHCQKCAKKRQRLNSDFPL